MQKSKDNVRSTALPPSNPSTVGGLSPAELSMHGTESKNHGSTVVQKGLTFKS